MNKTVWIIVGVVAVVALALTGCNRATFAQAQTKHERGEYFEAAAIYRKVYAKTPAREKQKRGEVAYQMGLCYEKLTRFANAAAAYQNAVRYGVNDSVASLKLARMLHAQAKYLQAEKQYEAYLQLNPISQLGQNGLCGVQMAARWRAQPTRYRVKRETLLNSRRADFSPLLTGEKFDRLYITSSNDKFVKEIHKSGVTGVKDNDLFLSEKSEKGVWQQPRPLEGELNTEADEGTPTISTDGQKMYLSRSIKSDKQATTVGIVESTRSGGKWSRAVAIDLWGDSTVMAAHPSVSPQGDWLYFVSDRLGGYGGKDIWRAAITPTGFDRPENLGPRINTAADELFPTIRANGYLYFSSNGLPGMGGLDLFCARPTEGGSWMVDNMQYPLNSSADDFGITFAGEAEEGLFSSNRSDARGWDHLYSFTLPTVAIYLEGFVVDPEDNIVTNATLRLVGNDGTIIKTRPKADGTYRIKLDYGKRYVMQATAPRFLNDRHELTTVDREQDTLYVQDFVLIPTQKPVVIDNIFYAFDKADLLPQSQNALDSLVQMMNQHPTITIELAAHTDRKGSDAYNQRLSDRRARSVIDYLMANHISPDRLTSKGYGKSIPKTVNKKIAALYPHFLKEGDVLTEAFVESLPVDQQEVADQLNRRTEFTIVSTGYNLY